MLASNRIQQTTLNSILYQNYKGISLTCKVFVPELVHIFCRVWILWNPGTKNKGKI